MSGLVSGLGCADDRRVEPRPLTRVGDEVLDARVVEMIAERDGVDDATARAYAIEVLRIYQAAAQHDTEGRAEVKLSTNREQHLRRTALARVWLAEVFEPQHQPGDIPHDNVALQRARAQEIHPTIHAVCQLVAVPTEGGETRANDPAWLEAAHARFDPVAERMRRYVPEGDPEACTLMPRLIALEKAKADNVTLKVERSGFYLEACRKQASDGSCEEPLLAREWTAQVAKAEPGHFIAPFRTRFGLHLAYLDRILPATSKDDPDVDATIRRAVLPKWRTDELKARLDELAQRRTVRIAKAGAP